MTTITSHSKFDNHFTQLKGSCPICKGERKDCKTNGSLIFCRAEVFSAVGYRYIKDDAVGFHMWAEDNGSDRPYNRIVPTKPKGFSKPSLSLLERHNELTKLITQLPLSNAHREALKGREMGDRQIDEMKFFTIPNKPYRKKSGEIGNRVPLSTAISSKLSGISGDGKYLYAQSSIGCPIWDSEGRLSGFQIRLDNPTDGNKYLWTKDPQLPNRELPIGFYGREFYDPNVATIALTESPSIKPYLASQKLKMLTVGCSGGNFTNSKGELLQQLREAIAELGAKKLILYADGGAVANPTVSQQYFKLFRAAESLGVAIEVCWWGQTTKAKGDIDEIDVKSVAFSYLSPKEYWRLTNFYIPLSEYTKGKSLNKVADLSLKVRYIPSDLTLQTKGVVAIKSQKGTGKSQLMKAKMAEWKQQKRPIVSLSPRKALCAEQSEKYGIDVYAEIAKEKEVISNQFTLCWDSIWKIRGMDLTNAVLLIDEWESGFKHLLTSSTIKDRDVAIAAFVEIVKRTLESGGLVLLLDADISDDSMNFWKAAFKETPYLIMNEDVTPKQKVELISFSSGEGNITDSLKAAIKGGKKVAVATDSKADATAIANQLDKEFPNLKGALVCSETTSDPKTSLYTKQPNEAIKANLPNWLIYTPSMGMGVSIDVEHFDVVYGLFNGVIGIDDILQSMCRVRANIDWKIWVSTKQIRSDEQFSYYHTAKEILNELQCAERGVYKILSQFTDDDDLIEEQRKKVKGGNFPTFLTQWAKKTAYGNFERANIYRLLRDRLKAEGYCVDEYATKERNEDVKEAKKGLKVDRAVAIANANDISYEEAKNLSNKDEKTKEEQNSIAKAYLKRQLPTVELTEDFVYKWVVKDGKKPLDAVKLYWAAKNFNKTVAKELNRKRHITDKSITVAAKLVRDLGLLDLVAANPTFSKESKEAVDLKAKCLKRRKVIFETLGVRCSKETEPITLLKNLFAKIGFYLDKGVLVRCGDERLREYRISNLMDGDRLAIYDSLSLAAVNYEVDKQIRATERHKEMENLLNLIQQQIYQYEDHPYVGFLFNSVWMKAVSEYIGYEVEPIGNGGEIGFEWANKVVEAFFEKFPNTDYALPIEWEEEEPF